MAGSRRPGPRLAGGGRRGTLAELAAWAEGPVKGEVVVVIEGAGPESEPDDGELAEALKAAMASGASRRDAAAEVAAAYGVPRRRAYALAVALKPTDRG